MEEFWSIALINQETGELKYFARLVPGGYETTEHSWNQDDPFDTAAKWNSKNCPLLCNTLTNLRGRLTVHQRSLTDPEAKNLYWEKVNIKVRKIGGDYFVVEDGSVRKEDGKLYFSDFNSDNND